MEVTIEFEFTNKKKGRISYSSFLHRSLWKRFQPFDSISEPIQVFHDSKEKA